MTDTTVETTAFNSKFKLYLWFVVCEVGTEKMFGKVVSICSSGAKNENSESSWLDETTDVNKSSSLCSWLEPKFVLLFWLLLLLLLKKLNGHVWEMYLTKILTFIRYKKPPTSVLVQFQNTLFFAKFCLFFPLFSFFALQTLKKHISTSVWSTRGKNAGRNIQQSVLILKHNLYVDTFF